MEGKSRSKGPPPKPAKRKSREAPSAPPPDEPPPRPQSKDRPRPVPVTPASSVSAAGKQDDSKFQPLDLGREHEGIPHGWSPTYWKYVTRPNKMERSRQRLQNITAYYRISKVYDIGLMLCLLLVVILVILAGVFQLSK